MKINRYARELAVMQIAFERVEPIMPWKLHRVKVASIVHTTCAFALAKGRAIPRPAVFWYKASAAGAN